MSDDACNKRKDGHNFAREKEENLLPVLLFYL
jgi:hypothetical protein